MEMEMMWSLQAILLFLGSFLFLIFFYRRDPDPLSSMKNSNSRIKEYPIVGCLPEFLKNRERFLDWTTEVLGEQASQTVMFRRPGLKGVLTANPKNVEHALKTHFEAFPKGDHFTWAFKDLLGRGIFNSDGDLWKVQRKTASFEFNTKSLRNFVVDTVRFEIQHRLLPLLQQAFATGQTIDLQDVLERFAFDNVCQVAFGADPACLGGGEGSSSDLPPDFACAFNDATNLIASRLMYAFPYMWRIKKLLNVGSERRLRESIAIVDEYATRIIRARKKDEAARKENKDLLSRFMASGESSEEFLRDIIVSFILAGRDTTSTALAWFFWLLSSSPDVEQKIVEELKSIRARNACSGEFFEFEELREMHYLHASISEAMRLYPPVAVDMKECLRDELLPDGTFIERGWFLAYDTYAMGRMESIWGRDWCSFKPERWVDEQGCFRPESPFKYPIFHAGPRVCLGKEMAFIQMKSIAAYVLERFVVDVPGKDTCPKHTFSFTLRMKDGLPVRVRPRN